MRHSWRKIIALGFCGWVAMGLVLPGCSGRLGPVRVTQNGGSIGYANLEQTKECVAEYGQQMAAGRIDLDATVNVNEDGDLIGVTLDGVPKTAPDFGACLRHVLREMPIAEQPFREGVKMLDFHLEHANGGMQWGFGGFGGQSPPSYRACKWRHAMGIWGVWGALPPIVKRQRENAERRGASCRHFS